MLIYKSQLFVKDYSKLSIRLIFQLKDSLQTAGTTSQQEQKNIVTLNEHKMVESLDKFFSTDVCVLVCVQCCVTAHNVFMY